MEVINMLTEDNIESGDNNLPKLINQKGKFTITRDLILQGDNRALLKLFSHMIIVRAEYLFMRDAIEYEALSPLFRVVDETEVQPNYVIIATTVYGEDQSIIDWMFEAKEVK